MFSVFTDTGNHFYTPCMDSCISEYSFTNYLVFKQVQYFD